MKKLAIIASSAALAALPVVGVFADTNEATDTISVEVNDTCTFTTETSAGKTASATLSAGEKKEDMTGSNFKINCNKDGGWYLKAKSGDESAQLTGTGDPIATGTTFSGEASAWAMKITATGTTGYQDTFNDWHKVPTTETDVLKDNSAANGVTVQATYGVYISGSQKAGTYTGSVLYTLGSPAGA